MGARSDLKLILAQNSPAYLLSFSQSSSVTLAIKITDVLSGIVFITDLNLAEN